MNSQFVLNINELGPNEGEWIGGQKAMAIKNKAGQKRPVKIICHC